MHDVDLQKVYLTDDIMDQVVERLRAVSATRIMWFSCFWQVVIPDDTPLEQVPGRIGRQIVYYLYRSEVPPPSLAAVRGQVPGVVWDTTNYLNRASSVLRPGVMLSSSRLPNGEYYNTTSGVLASDPQGEIFITASSNGFNPDGEVWHPSPDQGGILIGEVIRQLPHTDVCLIKLKKGTTYINETFQSKYYALGMKIQGLSVPEAPESRIGDMVTMNNPYSGYADGSIVALGCIDDGGHTFAKLNWIMFQCGNHAIAGSCGSPILDENGRVLSFFRYEITGTKDTFGFEASQLKERFGVDAIQGQYTF